MRKTIYFFLITCIFMSLTACGYKEGIVQSSTNSYLQFTGNIHNAFVTIDDSDPFPIQSKSENGKTMLYQVSSGKHKIVLKRDNNVVLNREVLVGQGMTKEIHVR